MKVIPVIDLLGGIVVRGVAGRREEYRQVESCLTDRADALSVACAFRERLGLCELYLADLDAILHGRPNLDVYRALADEGFRFLVDAGVRDTREAHDALAAGAEAVVAGLETSRGPRQLNALCREFGAERVVFSLDLQAGRPLGDVEPWQTSDPFEIAAQAVAEGVRRLIVLDLASVGIGEGVSTEPLCRRLLEQNPHLRLITGGGLRGIEDVKRLQPLGLDGVLVASALHDGSLDREALERLE